MKKVFIILGVIILSIMMSSCKERQNDIEEEKQPGTEEIPEEVKKEYKFFSKGDIINQEIKETTYAACFEMIDQLSLENIAERLEKERAYYVTIGDDIKDYYVCGYISNSIKDDLINKYSAGPCNPFTTWFFGKESYLEGWNSAVLSKFLDENEYPIVWYEIPKSEEVPMEIDDMFLVLIAESRNIVYESIDGLERYEFEMLYENRKFYDDTWDEEKFLNEIEAKKESIIIENDKFLIKKAEAGLIAPMFIYGALWVKSFIVEYHNDIPYVNIGEITSYNGVDLKETEEYIETKWGTYLFKLEKIVEIIKEIEK